MANPLSSLERRTIAIGSRERTYWLAPKPDGVEPAPLLVVLHGSGMAVRVMVEWTGLATRGPAAGFTTVFPAADQEMWDDTGRGRRDGANDDAFITALVRNLAEAGLADPRAVFLVGLSNGGFFAERLARAAIVNPKGIVLVASTTRAAIREDTPSPKVPAAVLCFAGTADRLVPYAGGHASGPLAWLARRRVRRLLRDRRGREVIGAERLANEWAGTNGATPEPKTEAIAGTELPVTRLTWTAPKGPPVVLYRIEGGGHVWPGAPQYLPSRLVGRVPSDLDATGILLSFARVLAARNEPRPTAPAPDPRS